MATAAEVIALHKAEPDLCATDIAKRLRCSHSYVRATAKRRKLPLPKGRPGRKWVWRTA